LRQFIDKEDARELVWQRLKSVAKPDSRFHFDFNEFIPDFHRSDDAKNNLIELEVYRSSDLIFATPDNCLEEFREQIIVDGKTLIMPTYGIRRGFVLLRPEDVGEKLSLESVSLDCIERIGSYINLADIRSNFKIDLLVTGASAVNCSGVRFGKGHGFFDLEWAMLYQIGAVNQSTIVVAFVHECQVVDMDLEIDEFDTICDYIVTPMRVISVKSGDKPTCGVVWNKLADGILEDIPPLQELKSMNYSSIK
tara:strand:- start:1251 stop:2003 length:753 start_codon:yes stop_codon:yes gene_type:complete